MPIRTVGEYLKRWSFTPQKPVKRAYQWNDIAVQNWLKSDFIKVFQLPGCSFNLNLDEYLNRDLKSNLNNKPPGRAKGKIEEHAKAYMDDVSRNPDHIAKLFHAESVLYAS